MDARRKTEALPAEAKGALLDETGLPKKLQRIMRRKEVTAKLQGMSAGRTVPRRHLKTC